MNLYLGNLNYRVKEGDLERALAVYGTVHSVKIIKDRETGKSKGFGFVEMDDEAASQAIKELSGSDFMGRQMVIKEALPKARKTKAIPGYSLRKRKKPEWLLFFITSFRPTRLLAILPKQGREVR